VIAIAGTSIRLLAATATELPHAQALVFEYMAATQGEAGRTVPTSIDQLPGILHAECTTLATVYQPPGGLFLAYRDTEPVGCVGLKPTPLPGAIEVKRLYVRPAHRGCGTARLLMRYAHSHATRHGFTRLVLDVMPTRSQVIDFYRRLGYTEAEPYLAEGPWPMIYMERPINQ
jgi:ribosomal protein S18 acetylase RimI-like enzyme